MKTISETFGPIQSRKKASEYFQIRLVLKEFYYY